jgi:hypothetical protein
MILLILQFSFFLFSHYQVLFTPLLEHPQLCSSLKWNIFKGQKRENTGIIGKREL